MQRFLKILNTLGLPVNPATEEGQDLISDTLTDGTQRSIVVSDSGVAHDPEEAKIDNSNSSDSPLLANASFTGAAVDVSGYTSCYITVVSDADSAALGLEIQSSHDGITWIHSHSFTYNATGDNHFEDSLPAKYYRIFYTNGAADQNTFALQVKLLRGPSSPHIHPIDYALTEEHPAAIARAVIAGKLGSSKEVVNIVIDPSTRSLPVLDYDHAEIHAGERYLVRDFFSLAKNGVKEFLIVTPNNDKLPHMSLNFYTAEAPIVVEFFSGATVSVLGSLITPINRNQNAPVGNLTLIYESPTVTTDGSVQGRERLGGGRGDFGESRSDLENILKKNTIHLIRITEQNIGVTYVNYRFDWYEHTDKSI